MSTKRKNPPVRKETVTLTISLPKNLKQAILEAAEADKRNASNYIVNELTKLLASAKAPKS